MTVSGVHCGKQREIYDQRRREVLPDHGIELVELDCTDFEITERRRLIRDERAVGNVLRKKLSKYLDSHRSNLLSSAPDSSN